MSFGESMNHFPRIITLNSIPFLLAACIFSARGPQATLPEDWRRHWGLAQGLSLTIDTEGYQLPTAIAFVPEPGDTPDDPLYFVTELRGRIKVVTNNRTVHTFVEDFFSLTPEKELPAIEGEVGLAGICLAPEQGFVFVTFAYQDADGLLRNSIMRFDTTPQTFALQPTAHTSFARIFADYQAAVSHQIGSCSVDQDMLYVSVGDGRQTAQSQQIDSVLGKVLRMSLDGEPLSGNPYYADDGVTRSADYVWAYGLRNPFALTTLEDRVFVVDNGRRIDRFLEVKPGENYFWDGNDLSIGTYADAVVSPSVAPVHVDYLANSGPPFPAEYREMFFVSTSANADTAGVLAFPYGLAEGRMVGVPKFVVRYRGEELQRVTGLAFGPDGLYFAPIMPDASGSSAVLKLFSDPEHTYPTLLWDENDAASLINEKGCLGCHSLQGEGGQAGPALDQGPLVASIKERVHSQAYLDSLDELDQLEQEPYVAYREAREEIRQTQNMERVRTWTIYHITEPRFDNPNSQMPNLGLTKVQATLLTDYLIGEEQGFVEQLLDLINGRLPSELSLRHLLYAAVAGGVAGMGFVVALWGLWRLNQRRRTRVT
jgi:glucose/arabinose dehydrogenase